MIYSSLTDEERVYSSLTEVHIEDGKVKPEPIKKFSLYGEEI